MSGLKIFDRYYKKLDLLKYFGEYSSIAGVKRYKLIEGKSEGCSIIEVKTGTGLVFEINETRGLDIGRCSYGYFPISYQSYNKEVHSNYYETFGDGWLRNFLGGMLITCGLKSIGKCEIDNDEILPLHGRISNIPADNINVNEYWKNDKLYFEISGKIRETKALCYNLNLNRSITVQAGTNKIFINDKLENLGFNSEEFMLLYHFNIGHPILDKYAKLLIRSKSVIPRDYNAKIQSENYYEYLEPTCNYKDIVYYHTLYDNNDICKVAIINEKINMGISFTFKKSQLDCFTQWKFTGFGNYVAGIEPCTSFVDGRSVERDKGRLKIIKSQEIKNFELEIEILTNKCEIEFYKNNF